ncbi:MAG: MoaD/ThiS family protein [Deltaproteobacteria bacterium]|nr:MoaD/ThiS family protein [Deltaproteobacteria bacterium]MBW2112483.1 MoaD/ThiS family protein [Deltaproteobacteria bacterium]MBW2354367.1 MoaD/ThiS family protein [Deltaproteobacteria bacterium]
MDVEIPDRARVRDLLACLEISISNGGVVAVGGRLISEDTELDEGVQVSIFQSVFGG